MTRQAKKYPEISLSHSSIQRLFRCERMHYWHVYGSDPRTAGSDIEAQRAQLGTGLKRLTSLDQLLGTALHQEAKRCICAIRDRRPLPREVEIRLRLDQCIARALNSQPDRYRYLRTLPESGMLRSAFYGNGEASAAEIERVTAKIPACAHNLANCRMWDLLARFDPGDFRIIDQLRHFHLPLEGGRAVRVWVKADLIVHSASTGRTLLVEFKSGSGELDVADQVRLYGLYAILGLGLRFDYDEGDWEAHGLNVFTGESEWWYVDEAEFHAAETRLKEAAEMIIDLLKDPATGEPLPMQHFPVVNRRQRWLCRSCPFLLLCQSELAAADGASAEENAPS